MATMFAEPTKLEVDFETMNWRKAREEFLNRQKDRNSDNVQKFLAERIDGPGVRDIVVNTQNQANNKYPKGLGGILSKIDILMKMGDVAIKSAPESVGLAWMGIRLCLHSFEDDFATFQLFSGACSDILGIMISCRVYGKMYGSSEGPEDFQELHSKVVNYIPVIYTDILEFSYKMKKHTARKVAVRLVRGMFSSSRGTFQPLIDGIKLNEETMGKYATTASQRLTIHYEKVGHDKMDRGLENQQLLMTDMAFIKEAMDDTVKVNQTFMIHIQQMEEDQRKNMKKKTPFDKAKDQFEDNAKKLNPSTHPESALRTNLERRKPDDTCRWIFDLAEYKNWHDSEKSGMLWVSGAGGFGKSVVMSAVIHELQTILEEDNDETTQFFFCSKGDDGTQTSARIKRHLLYHLGSLALAEESPELLERVNDTISDFLKESDSKQKKSDKSLTFDDAYIALAKTVNKKVILVIDALDEIVDRKQSGFLQSLRKMTDAPDSQVKIVVGSRPNSDIEEELGGIAQIKIEEHNGPDIERNVKSELQKLPGLSPAEKELACKAIVEKARGLFRCVEPAIDFLKKPFQRPISRRLEALPDGLNNSYLQILRQTDRDYVPLLETSLQWAILAQLKPKVAEIMDEYSCAYAEGVEGDETNPYDDPDNTLSSEQIRTAGGSTFLEVTGGEIAVRHTTVSDFFLETEESPSLVNNDSKETCTICRTKSGLDRPFILSKKRGHLDMTLTMFENLNSSLFQSRYLKADEEPASEEAVTQNGENRETNPEVPAQEDGVRETLAEDSNAEQQSAVEEVAEKLASTNLEVTRAQDTNGVLTNGISSQIPASEETVNIANTRSDTNGVNGVDTKDFQEQGESLKVLQDSEVPRLDQPNGTEVSAGGKMRDDGEGEEPAATTEEEYDPFADHETELDDADSEPMETGSDAGEGEASRVRYEISHWPYHLMMAEKLWPASERESNEDWKRLWDLAVKFLCDSPTAFKSWQQQWMETPQSPYLYLWEAKLKPLHIAAACGLTGLAEILIKHGQSASEALEDGRQPLWFAAGKDINLIKLLLDAGGDPNSRNNFPPPFHWQLGSVPKLDAIRLFLEHDSKLDILDGWDYNAMHWFSVVGSDVSVLELLLKHGGDINVVDDIGETPLHKLLSRREVPLDLLRAYIKYGAEVNRDDKDSQRPLYEVSMEGNTEAAKILLDNDADIEDDDKHGITALHIAAYYGHFDTVKLLSERGPKIRNKGDNHARTAFFFACQNGHLETARFLLATSREHNDDDVDKAMDDGRTAFTKAAGRGHVEVVKMLLEDSRIKATLNTVETKQERTALHRAAYNGRNDVVSVLLEAGADPLVLDSSGKTALGLCSQAWAAGKKSGDFEPILLALIDLDRDTAAKDDTLLFTAAVKGSTTIVEKLLVDAKISPNIQDEHSWTPLQHAKQYGHVEVATILSKRGAEIGSRPSRWFTESDRIKLSEDGTEVQLAGEELHTTFISNHPIPAGIEKYYYEVEIQEGSAEKENPIVGFGFATAPVRVDKFPGWYNKSSPSWGYHGDDGGLFANSNMSKTVYGGGPYGPGDTIGMGIVFEDGVNGKIFYTRNGKFIGIAFDKDVKGRLFPVHGIKEKSTTRANFGLDVKNQPFKWDRGNSGDFDLAYVMAASEGEDPPTTGADDKH